MTSVEYKVTLNEHCRNILGDDANDFITDEQIDSAIELHAMWGQRTTEKLVFYNNKGRSSYPKPVHEVLVDIPVTGSTVHVYRIDESTKLVEYMSGGTAPSDEDTITISYVEVRFNKIMADLFETAASAHAKMASSQSVGGIALNTSNLSKEFMKLAQYWACKDQW